MTQYKLEKEIPSFEILYSSIKDQEFIRGKNKSYKDRKSGIQLYSKIVQCLLNSTYLSLPFIILNGVHYTEMQKIRNRIELNIQSKSSCINVHALHRLSEKYESINDVSINSATGKKSYTCGVCYKNFTTRGHLSRHKKLHFCEKKYQCPWNNCNARFLRRDNWKQHFQVHQKQNSNLQQRMSIKKTKIRALLGKSR